MGGFDSTALGPQLGKRSGGGIGGDIIREEGESLSEFESRKRRERREGSVLKRESIAAAEEERLRRLKIPQRDTEEELRRRQALIDQIRQTILTGTGRAGTIATSARGVQGAAPTFRETLTGSVNQQVRRRITT